MNFLAEVIVLIILYLQIFTGEVVLWLMDTSVFQYHLFLTSWISHIRKLYCSKNVLELVLFFISRLYIEPICLMICWLNQNTGITWICLCGTSSLCKQSMADWPEKIKKRFDNQDSWKGEEFNSQLMPTDPLPLPLPPRLLVLKPKREGSQ